MKQTLNCTQLHRYGNRPFLKRHKELGDIGREECKFVFRMELKVNCNKKPNGPPLQRAHRHVPKSKQDLEYCMYEN